MQDSKLTISTAPVEGDGVSIAEPGLEPRPLTMPPPPPALDTARPRKRAGRFFRTVLKIIGSVVFLWSLCWSG